MTCQYHWKSGNLNLYSFSGLLSKHHVAQSICMSQIRCRKNMVKNLTLDKDFSAALLK